MSCVAAIGVDPGKSSGFAVCKVGDGRPKLLGADFAYGVRDLWWHRALDAIGRLSVLAQDVTPFVPPVFVENPPPTFREGSLGDGVTRGHAAWLGLGKHQGLCLGAVQAAEYHPLDIDQPVWVDQVRTNMGRIAAGKNEKDAGLRIREVSNLIDGAREFFQRAGAEFGAVPTKPLPAGKKRLIDVAEAMLISCAGGFLLLEHGVRIPAAALKSKARQRPSSGRHTSVQRARRGRR